MSNNPAYWHRVPKRPVKVGDFVQGGQVIAVDGTPNCDEQGHAWVRSGVTCMRWCNWCGKMLIAGEEIATHLQAYFRLAEPSVTDGRRHANIKVRWP